MMTRSQLMADVEAFLVRHSMKPTMFGVLAIGDRTLVRKMREGRSPRIDTCEKITAFMQSYKSRPRRPVAGNVRVAA